MERGRRRGGEGGEENVETERLVAVAARRQVKGKLGVMVMKLGGGESVAGEEVAAWLGVSGTTVLRGASLVLPLTVGLVGTLLLVSIFDARADMSVVDSVDSV